MGAHGKQSLEQVWHKLGLVEEARQQDKPSKAEIQDRMQRAEALYQQLRST